MTMTSTMGDRRIKVLFVAGSGRSGSTILERILDQVPGFAGIGELRYLWERGLVQNRLCGCGRAFGACDHWEQILKETERVSGPIDPRRMMYLQGRALRIRYLPLMTVPGGKRWLLSRLEEYPRVLNHLYRAIHHHTGSEVIVDSSKLPAYGYLVGLLPDVDLHVLHLVRDPRASAYSWMRKKALPDRAEGGFMERQRPWKSATLWSIWNATAELLWSRRAGRYLRVRYEDFVLRPRESVQAILRLLDSDGKPLPFVSESAVELAPNHTVAGNPSRFLAGSVELKSDQEWASRIRPWDRRIVTSLTWPLLMRYGYEVQQPGPSPGGQGAG